MVTGIRGSVTRRAAGNRRGTGSPFRLGTLECLALGHSGHGGAGIRGGCGWVGDCRDPIHAHSDSPRALVDHCDLPWRGAIPEPGGSRSRSPPRARRSHADGADDELGLLRGAGSRRRSARERAPGARQTLSENRPRAGPESGDVERPRPRMMCRGERETSPRTRPGPSPCTVDPSHASAGTAECPENPSNDRSPLPLS